jgi:hypothetical protein
MALHTNRGTYMLPSLKTNKFSIEYQEMNLRMQKTYKIFVQCIIKATKGKKTYIIKTSMQGLFFRNLQFL